MAVPHMADAHLSQTSLSLVKRRVTARVAILMTMITIGGAITIVAPHLRPHVTLIVNMIIIIDVTGSE